MPENYFDEWAAQNYKVLWPHLFEPEVVEPAVEFLADLAGDGPVLELGIGTGRLALPLSRRGIRVDGIELSAAMVEQLRAEPGSSDINVTIGDFSTTKVDGTYTLAYLVRNTIMNLTTVPRWRDEDLLGTIPERVAVRVGSHGPPCRDGLAGSVQQLEPRPVHEQQPQPYLGLADAGCRSRQHQAITLDIGSVTGPRAG